MAETTPVICIGGAPSSGTTLLADLLDSTPGIVCPPELYVFCVDRAYAFDSHFKRAACARMDFGVRARYAGPTRFFNDKYLAATGLDASKLNKFIAKSADLPEFISRVAERQSRFRRREVRVFAEKTPINVNHAEQFCRRFPEGLFVHVVRDGRAVAASLIRRHYTLYEAALIWMDQTLAGQKAAERPQVVEVRYEDLLSRPFEITASLAKRMGVEVAPDEIAAGFRGNEFRANLPRVKSWQVPEFTGTVESPATFPKRLSATNVAWLESLACLKSSSNGQESLLARFERILGHYGYAVKPNRYSARRLEKQTARCYEAYLKKTRNFARQADLRLVADKTPTGST